MASGNESEIFTVMLDKSTYCIYPKDSIYAYFRIRGRHVCLYIAYQSVYFLLEQGVCQRQVAFLFLATVLRICLTMVAGALK